MINRKNTGQCITINTDASFNSQHKIGGYAFYLICDLFKIQKSGYFKGSPDNSTVAETQCIANAISTLLAQRQLPNINYIILNTDSQGSIHDIENRKSGAGIMIADMLIELQKRTGAVKYFLKHVKAHSGKSDARSWVNEWCDDNAKRQMRKRVAQLLRERKKKAKEILKTKN